MRPGASGRAGELLNRSVTLEKHNEPPDICRGRLPQECPIQNELPVFGHLCRQRGPSQTDPRVADALGANIGPVPWTAVGYVRILRWERPGTSRLRRFTAVIRIAHANCAHACPDWRTWLRFLRSKPPSVYCGAPKVWRRREALIATCQGASGRSE